MGVRRSWIRRLVVVACASAAPACFSFAERDQVEQGADECRDGKDNDRDGLTDCEEIYCERFCFQNCTATVDNDDDGLFGCDDPECEGEPCWEPMELCWRDGDEDGNGSEGCDDPACALDFECVEKLPEDCGSGEDEDWDSKIDCADEDCKDDFENCPWEICDNGEDDDGDELVDCDDPACLAACGLIEICDSGEDEDGDGDIDCEDSQCAKQDVCIDGCRVSAGYSDSCDSASVCVCSGKPGCPREGSTLEDIGDFIGVIDLCQEPPTCEEGGTCRSISGRYTLRLSSAGNARDLNFIDWPELYVELNGIDVTGVRETFTINCDDCFTIVNLAEGDGITAALKEKDVFYLPGGLEPIRHDDTLVECSEVMTRRTAEKRTILCGHKSAQWVEFTLEPLAEESVGE